MDTDLFIDLLLSETGTLEDGIHRLGSIHRNGLLRLGANLITISVLPLHELITEVLVSSNSNFITFIYILIFSLYIFIYCFIKFNYLMN